MMQGPTPLSAAGAWAIVNTLAVTFATVAVAFFAGVELRRQRRDARSRQLSVDARASAEAYLLRRELQHWIGSGAPSEDALEAWIRRWWDGHTHRCEPFERARGQLRTLLNLAGEASPKSAGGIRDASVHLLEGITRLETYADTAQPSGVEFIEWLQQRASGFKDIQEAIRALEGGVIDRTLLNQEWVSRRVRAEDDPFAISDAGEDEVRRIPPGGNGP